ncbi:hypothetical protein C8R44DRAFT_738982 [Mycena epipterygia]|nr:hypothetical protein C8R44DRAFT_738982 [Mycena epipterygia]
MPKWQATYDFSAPQDPLPKGMITYGERNKFKHTVAGANGSKGATPLPACSGIHPPPPSAPNKENNKRRLTTLRSSSSTWSYSLSAVQKMMPVTLGRKSQRVKKTGWGEGRGGTKNEKEKRGVSPSNDEGQRPREAALHGKAQSRREEGAGRVDKACHLHQKTEARSRRQNAMTLALSQPSPPLTRSAHPPHATNGKMHRPATPLSTPPPPSTRTTRSRTGAVHIPDSSAPLQDVDQDTLSVSTTRVKTRSGGSHLPPPTPPLRTHARDCCPASGPSRHRYPRPASAPLQPPPTADARPVSSLGDAETETGGRPKDGQERGGNRNRNMKDGRAERRMDGWKEGPPLETVDPLLPLSTVRRRRACGSCVDRSRRREAGQRDGEWDGDAAPGPKRGAQERDRNGGAPWRRKEEREGQGTGERRKGRGIGTRGKEGRDAVCVGKREIEYKRIGKSWSDDGAGEAGRPGGEQGAHG